MPTQRESVVTYPAYPAAAATAAAATAAGATGPTAGEPYNSDAHPTHSFQS